MGQRNVKTIAISRMDHLGDLILTLPLAGLIKQHFPKTRVVFVVNANFSCVANACVHVDQVIGIQKDFSTQNLTKQLKTHAIDVIIHADRNADVARASKQAGIATRIGLMTQASQLFNANKYVYFSRKRSNLHESQLNSLFLKPLGLKEVPNLTKLIETLKLRTSIVTLPNTIAHNDKPLVVLHPGSNGNGMEWPPCAYIELIKKFCPKKVNVVITGSASEQDRLGTMIEKECPTIVNTMGTLTLTQLMTLMSQANCLIASGTGPLHLSAALGRPTLGLFPNKKSIGALRWGTLGTNSFSMAPKKGDNMRLISSESVYQWTKSYLLT
jgi:heptosyltransferase III